MNSTWKHNYFKKLSAAQAQSKGTKIMAYKNTHTAAGPRTAHTHRKWQMSSIDRFTTRDVQNATKWVPPRFLHKLFAWMSSYSVSLFCNYKRNVCEKYCSITFGFTARRFEENHESLIAECNNKDNYFSKLLNLIL